MRMRMTLPDAGTRAAMLGTGMEHGMEASFARLERQLTTTQQEGRAMSAALSRRRPRS